MPEIIEIPVVHVYMNSWGEVVFKETAFLIETVIDLAQRAPLSWPPGALSREEVEKLVHKGHAVTITGLGIWAEPQH